MAGDPINIKASRRGTFTAAADSHREGVETFAHQVLDHPGDYSEKMRKKAQFAENASHWHHGG